MHAHIFSQCVSMCSDHFYHNLTCADQTVFVATKTVPVSFERKGDSQKEKKVKKKNLMAIAHRAIVL